MILYAPAQAPVCSILMPDPELANSRGQAISSNLRTSRNGTQYTYVRKGLNKTLTYTFENMGRGKLVELQEFIKTYQGSPFRIEDHHGVMWSAFLTPETVETVMDQRAFPVLESGSITLEFTGQQL
jgi:hypothetical protein